MNRRILKWAVCLALFVGAGQTVCAQESDEAPKYHFGVRVGYMETNVRHDFHLDGHSDRNCQSFMGGLSFDTRLIQKPLYFETGLYAANRGVDVRDGSNRYAENNFSLLIPAMLSYHFYPTHDLGIAPFAGLFGAYDFGFEKVDYGVRLGFGVNYKQVCLHFGVDFGLKDDLFKNPGGYYESDGNLASYFVTLGWNFLGKR